MVSEISSGGARLANCSDRLARASAVDRSIMQSNEDRSVEKRLHESYICITREGWARASGTKTSHGRHEMTTAEPTGG